MPITIAGADYNVVFGTDPTNGAPRLYLIDSADAITYGTLDCCGEDYAIFAFGGATLCPGDRDCPPTPPSQNIIRLKVEWAECSAWYCAALATEGSGSGGSNCEPMYLTESEVCGDEFVVCSGPHASYADALADCPNNLPLPSGDCALCDVDPWYWTATLSGFGSPFTWANGDWVFPFWGFTSGFCEWLVNFEEGYIQIRITNVSATVNNLNLILYDNATGSSTVYLLALTDPDDTDCIGTFVLNVYSSAGVTRPATITVTSYPVS